VPQFTQDQIKTLWAANVNSTSALIASAIAMAESGGTSTQIANIPATTAYCLGLWQVNFYNGLGVKREKLYGITTVEFLARPATQAFIAGKISTGGTNWTTWTTYRDGTYLKFMGGTAPRTSTPAPPAPSTTAWRTYTYDVFSSLSTWVLSGYQDTQSVMSQAWAIFDSI
jgi:hypothetical protein